jgi:hypothetical protein
MSISLLRRLLMKEAVKDTAGSSGIMSINKNIAAKVEKQLQKYVNDAMQQGVDLDTLSPEQLKMIVQINKPKPPRVIAADSPEGREITEKLFGKRGEVVDMTGKKLDTSQGIMGGKSVKELMDSGQVTKGARGMKKSKKVQDREMFKAANKRLTSDVDSIIKDIKSMEPITAMKEASSVIGRKGKYKNLTEEQSKKILQDTEDHIFQRDIPEDPEGFAKGGRIGFKGGADMGTVADSKGNVGAKSVSVSPSGSVTTSNQAPSGPDDKGSPTQNLTQYLVNQGVSPKEIRKITGVDKPSAIDKIKNSPYNNPFTRGILRAGLYTLNPSLGALDFRKAMQLKELYDTTMDSYPDSEDDMTLGLITDQQKGIIDKQGNMGKLTGAFDPDSTFDAAKQFDDKGSSGIFGIGGKPAEPMTREEFDNYIKEKNYATGGIARANFVGGGMGRRGFLKMLAGLGGGIAAAKTGLLKLAGKEPAKQVAKEVVQKSTTGSPPPYFFKLAEKIKMMGDDATATTDRTIAKTLKSKDGKSTYVLEEDVATGDTIIKKVNKEGDEMMTDVEIMELKKGEVVQGKDGRPVKVPDEYEEVTEVNARIEGDTFNDPYFVDGIKIDEIIKEIGEQAPSIKKASGGIARMLGE